MAANGNLFTAADRTALVVLARALYPHAGLRDAPYARTAGSIVERASVDPVLYHVLTDGLGELRRACPLALELTAAPELQAALGERETTAFFGALRPLVAWYLYDDHEVWEFIGYPGASYEFGGYLHRGFDDLSWLPEPRIEEPDEALPEIGPLAGMKVAQ